MTVVIDGRTWTMERDEGTFSNLEAHLISRGFDGKSYRGVSLPVGKQRKRFDGLFFRSAKTGEFISAV